MRYLTAGESHGEALTGIIEGLPAGLEISVDFIDEQLRKRQNVVGRGERARSITDHAVVTSGVNDGVTTGAPLCIVINNGNCQAPEFDFFRPGHVDYVACKKYGYEKAWLGAERASARETAIRTALGAVTLKLLNELGISVRAQVVSSGSIDEAQIGGDTVGGKVQLTVSGMIAGVGSHVFWDRRLDSRLGGALFGIPAVKAVECGMGVDFASALGSECADEFALKDGAVKRTSNNCGGIEGGISNGEDIIFKLTIKPVPSLKDLKAIDISGKERLTEKVRGDVCAAYAACAVAESVAALELASALIECLGGDTMAELKERYEQKRRTSCRK